MGPLKAVKSGFRQYANLFGRASRSEFWWWQVFVNFFGIAFSFNEIAAGIFSLITLMPSISIYFRRLQDVNVNRWCGFLYIPFVVLFMFFSLEYAYEPAIWTRIGQIIAGIGLFGAIMMIAAWLCWPGTKGPNRFGDDPLAP